MTQSLSPRIKRGLARLDAPAKPPPVRARASPPIRKAIDACASYGVMAGKVLNSSPGFSTNRRIERILLVGAIRAADPGASYHEIAVSIQADQRAVEESLACFGQLPPIVRNFWLEAVSVRKDAMESVR